MPRLKPRKNDFTGSDIFSNTRAIDTKTVSPPKGAPQSHVKLIPLQAPDHRNDLCANVHQSPFSDLFLQHNCNFRVRIQLFEKAVHIDAAKAARKGQVILWRNILPPYCNDRMIDKGLIDCLKLLIIFDVGSDDFCTKASC